MDEQSSGATASPHQALSVWKAILVGQLFVTLPVLIIMFGILLFGVTIKRDLWWLFLAIGFFLGWVWWSFTISRWRRWAIRRGAPADRLQKWAVATGLTWPKGWIFEKTEAKIDDE
ncbi:MAG: hypothetical protein M3362_14085 [Acidobacteriota bacterium]|nr:hypothetical protein [Acidobacteriota bacterium]